MGLRFRQIVFILVFIFPLSVFGVPTANQILQKTATALNNATGISATFKMSTGYGYTDGTFKAKGKNFCYLSRHSSTWYDGKTMWITNSNSKETTISTPSLEEVRESNPLEYLKTYSNKYTPTLVNNADKTQYVLMLKSKQGRNSLPSIELAVNRNSFKPVSIKIMQKGTKPITITLFNVNYRASISESDFKYPKSKFPGYELVDVR